MKKFGEEPWFDLFIFIAILIAIIFILIISTFRINIYDLFSPGCLLNNMCISTVNAILEIIMDILAASLAVILYKIYRGRKKRKSEKLKKRITILPFLMILIAVLFVIAVYFIINYESNQSKEENHPLIGLEQAKQLRDSTFDNCQNLLNKTVNFNGTILYEDCGRNCLGGCPGSGGPVYCYYGIESADICMVYVKSRETEYTNPLGVYYPERVFNKFNIGQQVEIKGYVMLHENTYYECFQPGCVSGKYFFVLE